MEVRKLMTNYAKEKLDRLTAIKKNPQILKKMMGNSGNDLRRGSASHSTPSLLTTPSASATSSSTYVCVVCFAVLLFVCSLSHLPSVLRLLSDLFFFWGFVLFSQGTIFRYFLCWIFRSSFGSQQ
jgi:hypothetical protein